MPLCITQTAWILPIFFQWCIVPLTRNLVWHPKNRMAFLSYPYFLVKIVSLWYPLDYGWLWTMTWDTLCVKWPPILSRGFIIPSSSDQAAGCGVSFLSLVLIVSVPLWESHIAIDKAQIVDLFQSNLHWSTFIRDCLPFHVWLPGCKNIILQIKPPWFPKCWLPRLPHKAGVRLRSSANRGWPAVSQHAAGGDSIFGNIDPKLCSFNSIQFNLFNYELSMTSPISDVFTESFSRQNHVDSQVLQHFEIRFHQYSTNSLRMCFRNRSLDHPENRNGRPSSEFNTAAVTSRRTLLQMECSQLEADCVGFFVEKKAVACSYLTNPFHQNYHHT